MLLSGKQYRLIDPSRYGLISNQLFFQSPKRAAQGPRFPTADFINRNGSHTKLNR